MTVGDRLLVERAPDGDRARGALGVWSSSRSIRTRNASRRLCGAAPRPSSPAASSSSVYSGLPSLRAYSRSTSWRSGVGVEDVGERLAELVAVERLELDPAGALEPIELGQQRPQRMAAVELVGAVGQHQHDPLLAQAAGQERDKRAGRAIGPVHVLEDQHHRRGLAEQVEQFEHRLEQPQLARRRPAARRVDAPSSSPGSIVASWARLAGPSCVAAPGGARAPAAAARPAAARRELAV